MSSTAAIASPGAPKSPPHIARLWRDTTRTEQLARLNALELQPCDEQGQQVWRLAQEAWRDLPEGARIDLPSARVFGRVLGLFRTGATLKSGKLLRLEISAQEIADLVGYSKATVEACLRWLGSEAIQYQGAQVSRGLGLIHRGRRTAWAFLNGIRQRVYRTSRLVLTLMGRLALGLADRSSERKQERRAAKYATKPAVAAAPAPSRDEIRHIQNQAGGEDEHAADPEVSRAWFRRIHEALR